VFAKGVHPGPTREYDYGVGAVNLDSATRPVVEMPISAHASRRPFQLREVNSQVLGPGTGLVTAVELM
jgi:hypothetical protein